MNPFSALTLPALAFGIFSFVGHMGNKAPINVSFRGDSGKSSAASNANQFRNRAAQLCAA
jgi:hypothetical protein